MIEMEMIFKIPMLKNTTWEKENPRVIELYRKVSDSRKSLKEQKNAKFA
ncbi:Uncharacterised protein [Exiguobacterium aurantiacum]|uniref:Uncharacterized protein n=1 Tax=Exiguobacterium aurantiacum TaxID=33987 RepID=A0A377HHI2_9BACL|nr:Uncharacterised protein [Exiguobacterium aurantiacum]